jgi:hypothetical protein
MSAVSEDLELFYISISSLSKILFEGTLLKSLAWTRELGPTPGKSDSPAY